MTTTIADFEEDQLAEHLISGGFLGAFTDIFGNTQPAPVVQMLEFDLTNVQPDERIIMIRNKGGINNSATRIFLKQQSMLIAVVGNTGSSDSYIAKGLANDIEKWLTANTSDGKCMFNIQTSGVSGPFIFDDSRRVYEVNVRCDFNIDKPSFG